jgi:peptide deformylase
VNEEVTAQEIVRYGDVTLRTMCTPVETITPELKEFIAEMFNTLRRVKGIGLSAPQVGVSKRFFILDLTSASLDFDELVMINPEIISIEGEQTGEEGCLSFPGLYLEITRPNRVVCRYFDLEGNENEVEAEGLFARAILHETDHLNGKLFIDLLEPAEREMISGKLKKIKVGA